MLLTLPHSLRNGPEENCLSQAEVTAELVRTSFLEENSNFEWKW